MSQKIALFIAILASFSAQAADFSCPVVGVHRTADEMYSAMTPGNIFGNSSQIVFVDERNELVDSAGKLTPIGQTFLDSNQQLDIRGTFKIGYDYSAKECRRQIVLTKEIAPGVWEGYTAIEICNPNIMAIFAKAQGKSFDDVWKQIEALANQAQAGADALSKKEMEDANGVCYQAYDNKTGQYTNGTNYDEKKCEAVQAKINGLSDQASKLQSLKIEKEQQPYVSYFTDSAGIVLPRFKVTAREFYFQRTKKTVSTGSRGIPVETKGCNMSVTHGTSYAGLAGGYKWHFNYDLPTTAAVWTYDAKGVSTAGPKYEQDPKSINFKDLGEYFFLER